MISPKIGLVHRNVTLIHTGYRWQTYGEDVMQCLSEGFKSFEYDLQNSWDIFGTKQEMNHLIFGFIIDGRCVSTATAIPEVKLLRGGSLIYHIEDVATMSNYRGKGYATETVRCLVDCLSKLSLESVVEQPVHSVIGKLRPYKFILDCSDKNVPFYQNIGFHKSENCMRFDVK